MPLYPRQPLPDWADPAQASVMDPLYKTLARRATSTLGLDDPSSQIMNAAMPMTNIETGPIGTVKGALKADLGPKAEAAATLIKQLLGFNANPVDKNLVPTESLMRRVPSPLRFDDILKRTLTRVPEARDMFEIPGSVVKRAPGLPSRYQAEAAIRGGSKPTQEAGLLADVLSGKYERPSVRSFAELSDIAPSPSNTVSGPRPALSGYASNGIGNAKAMSALSRSGLTQEDVRLIRTLSKEEATQKYPKIGPDTLSGIRRKDTFSWIKD